ncbi:hypothetical protein [Variovorax sp. GT1P44]|uniref:hypothetical protein n=1 Tax=Variovorax sp. GT1P44 TaxID=3443742 RepID=UPI003F47C03F
MDSEICTLVVLALLVAGGWIIDVLIHREPPTRIERLMRRQVRRSPDAIRRTQRV